MGGLLESVKVYAYASRHGVRVWGGTMPESGLVTSAIASLASFAGFVYASYIEDSTRWFGPGNDLIEFKMDASGRIPIDERGPGIGQINMDNFKRFAVQIPEIRRN